MKVMMKFWQLLVDAQGPPRKVIIIDDDDAFRETLKEQFTLHDEFEISDTATASAGLKQLSGDGRIGAARCPVAGYGRGNLQADAQERLSRADHHLTTQDTEADTILGLNSGPMTICKPFASGCCLPASGRRYASPWNRKIRHRTTMTTTLPPPDRAGLRMTSCLIKPALSIGKILAEALSKWN